MNSIGHPSRRAVLAACGDSITAGVHLPTEESYIYKLGRRYSCETLQAGIPGQTTRDVLARFNSDIVEHKPDICLLQFGMNDHVAVSPGQSKVPIDEFRSNLCRMIELLAAEGIVSILCTIHPVIEGDENHYYYSRHPEGWYGEEGANGWIRKYNEQIRSLATETHCHLADIAQQWVDAQRQGNGIHVLNRNKENAAIHSNDGVHPTAVGHDYYASCIGKVLERTNIIDNGGNQLG